MKGPARQDAGPSQGGEARLDAVRFCTHCGVLQDEAPQRVCPLCGLGMILTSHRRALPRSGAAFLVVTRSLRVSAASVASEELLGRPPEELLGGSVLALVG